MTDRVFIVTGGSQVGKAALIRLLQYGEVFQLGDAVLSNVRITGGGYTVSDDGHGRLLTEDGAVGEFGRVLTAARPSGSAQWKNEQRRYGPPGCRK